MEKIFRVASNGFMSEEENILSEVPEGTVLAIVLFVIMNSDMDENVKRVK